MALREYEWRGSTWQFDEDRAPKDAVPIVKAEEPAANKAAPAPPTKRAPRRAAKPNAGNK